jgi:replicative DNA helicase
VFEIAERQMRGGVVALKSALGDTFTAIEKAQEREGTLSGVETGYGDLNYLTGGLQEADMVILAARPSVGKTAMALGIARNAAIKGNTPVLIFSLEMAVQQLCQRFLCAEARVNSHNMRSGRLSEEDWSRLVNWTGKLAEAPIFIDDTAGISVLELRAKSRRAKMEHDIGLIVIDYLQLMTSSERTDNREQQIASISRSLKGLAKELNVPVLACAQLSRAVELRTDKRPQLSDLRESGSIEQDADVVMFLHRPGLYRDVDEEGNSLENKAEIIIGKQRNGPTGSVDLVWLPEYGRFEDREYLYLDEASFE